MDNKFKKPLDGISAKQRVALQRDWERYDGEINAEDQENRRQNAQEKPGEYKVVSRKAGQENKMQGRDVLRYIARKKVTGEEDSKKCTLRAKGKSREISDCDKVGAAITTSVSELDEVEFDQVYSGEEGEESSSSMIEDEVNPILARVQLTEEGHQDDRVIELRFQDIYQPNEDFAFANAVASPLSDSLLLTIKNSTKDELIWQIQDKPTANTLSEFWSMWLDGMQQGLISRSHLQLLHKKVGDKECRLLWEYLMEAVQEKNECKNTSEAAVIVSTPKKSPAGKFFMQFITPWVYGRKPEKSIKGVCRELFPDSQKKQGKDVKGGGSIDQKTGSQIESSWRYVSQLPKDQERLGGKAGGVQKKKHAHISQQGQRQRAASVLYRTLKWLMVIGIGVGLCYGAHTVLPSISVIATQSVWLHRLCVLGVGMAWALVVRACSQKPSLRGKDNGHQAGGKNIPESEKPLEKSHRKTPSHAKYYGLISAIDKTRKMVTIEKESQKNQGEAFPFTGDFSYQPLGSSELDQLGVRLEQYDDFRDKPAVCLYADEKNGMFSMHLPGS